MAAVGFVGSDLFYLLLLPCVYWNTHGQAFGRQIVVLFTLGVYVGNFLKNMFRMPPSVHPSTLRTHGNTDDKALQAQIRQSAPLNFNTGFVWPSLCAIHSITLPFFYCRISFGVDTSWDPSSNPKAGQMFAWYSAAFVWSGLVCLSRIYFGVECPSDIQAGMIAGAACLRFYLW